MRQIVLDTETTGLETSQDHRIIEIGCVELVGRKLTGRHYHQYINPQRKVDEGAMEVHGITDEFLIDKPLFATVAREFLEFVDGADLVIHNAPFDVGFINHEIAKLGGIYREIESSCRIIDTLALARQKHPGRKIISTPYANGMGSTIPSETFTAHFLMRRFSLTSIC